jgi:hypothetical protein
VQPGRGLFALAQRRDEASEAVGDVGRTQGLGDVGRHPQPQHPPDDLGVPLAGHDDDRGRLQPLVVSDGREDFQAIHDRHHQIEHDEVVAFAGEQVERIEAVVGLGAGAAEISHEYPGEKQSAGGVVVYDEGAHRTVELIGRPPTIFSRRRPFHYRSILPQEIGSRGVSAGPASTSPDGVNRLP